MRALLFVIAFAAGIAQANPIKPVLIQGQINGSHLKIARQLAEAPSTSTVVLHIDSEGGLADVGRQIINAIRQAQYRGVQIECVVVNKAMSVALAIHSYCDRRYALPATVFLWHSTYSNSSFTMVRLQLELETTADYNELFWRHLRAYFKNKEVYTRYYEHDGEMLAHRLTRYAPGYMKIIRTPYER